jgi:hypothetical protein
MRFIHLAFDDWSILMVVWILSRIPSCSIILSVEHRGKPLERQEKVNDSPVLEEIRSYR